MKEIRRRRNVAFILPLTTNRSFHGPFGEKIGRSVHLSVDAPSVRGSPRRRHTARPPSPSSPPTARSQAAPAAPRRVLPSPWPLKATAPRSSRPCAPPLAPGSPPPTATRTTPWPRAAPRPRAGARARTESRPPCTPRRAESSLCPLRTTKRMPVIARAPHRPRPRSGHEERRAAARGMFEHPNPIHRNRYTF